MTNVPELFGSLVFNDKTMKQLLPESTFAALINSKLSGQQLTKEVADKIADCMKDWAISKGATHFTHWFQPMTGITAEKHDSFITPSGDGVIMKFSGKELIKGEPDASSFPSGGLRSTFEARGYTAWDLSSYAFIKDNTLCIPTAFISFSGQVLDKKTPLLRSVKLLSNQAVRVLKHFGKNVDFVTNTVGAEQEYFLVDKTFFNKRLDLKFCGRTLFGAKPPKGQEMEDHYFGSIKPRVLAFMEDLDRELWKLGVLGKTRHNEAAPSQHELAPIYAAVNISTDHNQLTMEMMKKVAEKHNLVCLLHEKPFDGVNGSGKHNNWSISTETENLLEPTKTPETNFQFLLFMSAVIKAVDDHQDLLRLSVASAGNDHRLGGNEAPPAIISMFLGDDLIEIFDSLAGEKEYKLKTKTKMQLGVMSIPDFATDTADRNRTSPLAFTGNKFEFRMLGSAFNIACTNIMLNTIVGDTLYEFANRLDNAADVKSEIKKIISENYINHKRILFSGNNYSPEWHAEAQRRGLLNLPTTPDALPFFSREENVQLFEKHHIYTRQEIVARQEILLENYCKITSIEALTLETMINKEILPSSLGFLKELLKIINFKSSLSIDSSMESNLVSKITALNNEIATLSSSISTNVTLCKAIKNHTEAAVAFRDNVLSIVNNLRKAIDQLEPIISKEYWTLPTYCELLFSV